MLQNCSIWSVAQVFFNQPTTLMRLTDISKNANLAHTSTKTHLQTLQKHGLIEVRKEKMGTRIYPLYIAKQTTTFHTYKRIHTYLKLQSLLPELIDTYQPDCIVWFGSSEKGQDTETSDIDLFIQTSVPFSRAPENIQIHAKNSLKEYPPELITNILNGTVLYGYIDDILKTTGSKQSQSVAKNGTKHT